MRVKSTDVDKLYEIPFDPASNFMKVERDYDAIPKEATKVTETLKAIADDYAFTMVEEVKNKAEQLDLVNINPEHKKQIKNIIDSGKLPEQVTSALIEAINKLFVDIKVVTLKRSKLMNEIFRKDELLTLPQIREAFFNLYNKLENEHKGKEVRFKIEE